MYIKRRNVCWCINLDLKMQIGQDFVAAAAAAAVGTGSIVSVKGSCSCGIDHRPNYPPRGGHRRSDFSAAHFPDHSPSSALDLHEPLTSLVPYNNNGTIIIAACHSIVTFRL